MDCGVSSECVLRVVCCGIRGGGGRGDGEERKRDTYDTDATLEGGVQVRRTEIVVGGSRRRWYTWENRGNFPVRANFSCATA